MDTATAYAVLLATPAPKFKVDFTQISTLPNEITFSRAGNAMQADATGALTWAPSNLLLNTATLSTQNVTTIPTGYVLSFSGAGTVTLSGTSTAGPLVGTGASNRVYLAFTPTAGTLTLTVSGSVTSAQLEPVTYQTTPGPYVATTSAAYYGPRFDNTLGTANSPLGLLIEEARTNYVTQFNPFTTGWTLVGCTIGTLVASPDGTINASPVTNTGAFGYVTTNFTLPIDTSTYCASVFIKKTVGATVFPGVILYVGLAYYSAAVNTNTGTITARAIQPPSSTSITDAGAFWRVAITAPNASLAAASVQLYPVVNADAGAAWTGGTGTTTFYGMQVEKGTFATSPIFTTTAAVTRAADIVPLAGVAAVLLARLPYSVIAEFNALDTSAARAILFSTQPPNTGFYAASNYIDKTTGISDIQATVYTAGTIGRAGVISADAYQAVVVNGGSVVSNTNPGNVYSGGAWLGSRSGTDLFLNGYVRRLAIYTKRLPNLTLQAKTVLGAPL